MPGYFFAVAPPEPLISQIEAFRRKWGSRHHKVEPHITVKVPLLWEGDPEPFMKAVQGELEAIRPFDIQLGAPARFVEARVLYLSVMAPELKPMHQRVIQAMQPWAPVQPGNHEGDDYIPHLTLAVGRFGIDGAELDAMEQEVLTDLSALPPFRLDSLRLYHRPPGEQSYLTYRDLPLGSLE